MFLWSGPLPTHEVVITSPVNVTYGAKGAEFGPALTTTGLSRAIAAGVAGRRLHGRVRDRQPARSPWSIAAPAPSRSR